MTHRERLRASEEFNRRILERSPDCIKVLSLDARIELFSVGGLCAMEIDNFDSQWRGAHWVGIGLAMVRRLVEMHGGTVHAESAGRAMGSTFTVRLPKSGTQAQD